MVGLRQEYKPQSRAKIQRMPKTVIKKTTLKQGVRHISLVFALVVIVGGVAWCFSGGVGQAEKARERGRLQAERLEETAALALCQQAIAKQLPPTQQEKPPYTNGVKSAEKLWHFVWPQGSFSVKNRYGSSVAQYARCIVDPQEHRITVLHITGQDFIQ
ncbi:hypothetical protein E4695_06580 [Alcaligenaceae bacterium 429]|nr:hypothetical protein E4695_06580 [Alcaligenaceae bacterium 429]